MSTNTDIRLLSAWLDQGNAHQDDEATTWARLAKVAEGCAKVVGAYTWATGPSPRKGSLEQVEQELLAVAIAALGAIHHLHGNTEGVDVIDLLGVKAWTVLQRATTSLTGAESACAQGCTLPKGEQLYPIGPDLFHAVCTRPSKLYGYHGPEAPEFEPCGPVVTPPPHVGPIGLGLSTLYGPRPQ